MNETLHNWVKVLNQPGIEAHISDTRGLQILNNWDLNHAVIASAHEATQARRNFIARISECNEGGFVAIYSSGMDCDCSSWENRRHRVVPATVKDVEEAFDDILNWADGPMSLWVDRPSAQYEVSHRDLALEAFEDGHPHVVCW